MSGIDKESSESGKDDFSIAAAEYVLGLLSERERERVHALALRNPAFREKITKWEEHFSRFADELEPAAPPERVWREIRLQTERATSMSRVPPRPATRFKALWDSAGFWRGLAFGSLTIAIALGGYIAAEKSKQPAAKLVATISPNIGPAAFVAAYDPGRRQMLLVPSSLVTNEKRVPELWIVPKGLKPISLGVIDPSHPQAITIPEQLAPHARTGSALVITLEPQGGAPGGVATGAVIAQGIFSPI